MFIFQDMPKQFPPTTFHIFMLEWFLLYIYLCLFCNYAIRVELLCLKPLSKTTFISWRSVLFEEGTRLPGENNRPAASHWQTSSHNVVSRTPRLSRFGTHNYIYSDARHWLHQTVSPHYFPYFHAISTDYLILQYLNIF
jgi:hypothetical protein